MKKIILGTGLTMSMVFGALPAIADAATYAYVNFSGEVRTHEASSPASAIINAPGISTHSGVMLINSFGDNGGVVGNNVFGI